MPVWLVAFGLLTTPPIGWWLTSQLLQAPTLLLSVGVLRLVEHFALVLPFVGLLVSLFS